MLSRELPDHLGQPARAGSGSLSSFEGARAPPMAALLLLCEMETSIGAEASPAFELRAYSSAG